MNVSFHDHIKHIDINYVIHENLQSNLLYLLPMQSFNQLIDVFYKVFAI